MLFVIIACEFIRFTNDYFIGSSLRSKEVCQFEVRDNLGFLELAAVREESDFPLFIHYPHFQSASGKVKLDFVLDL